MSDIVREVMGRVGSIADSSFGRPSQPIPCEKCGEEFLFFATFCDHLPGCNKRPKPQRRAPNKPSSSGPWEVQG